MEHSCFKLILKNPRVCTSKELCCCNRASIPQPVLEVTAKQRHAMGMNVSIAPDGEQVEGGAIEVMLSKFT